MNQALLDLDTLRSEIPAPTVATDGANMADRVGFQIGWDHARHGLVPPAEFVLEGTPLGQGWRAGQAVHGGRTYGTSWVTRRWLALRVQAWREGADFDAALLTPARLARLHGPRCPVTRATLGGPPGSPDAPVFERLDTSRSYTPGNLAVLSTAASRARAGVGALEALRRAHRLLAGEPAAGGLDAAAWTRLAALRAFATPMPFHDAARLPLTVLPPPGVDLVNPVQRLQVLLTLQFSTPGWSSRTREIAQGLPAHTARQDYHLFIGALAPRVVEAGATPCAASTSKSLEDAWLHERVQRRWQHFVLSLGEAGVLSMIERIQACGSRVALVPLATAAGAARATRAERMPAESAAPRTMPGARSTFTGPVRPPVCGRTAPRPAACP
jgi:hypothetical protein